MTTEYMIDLTQKARTYQFENRSFSPDEINLISQQTSLVAISFKNCPITDKEIKKISSLKKLINITLENTAITDLALKYLSNIQTLQYLFISKAKINGEGLKFFENHQKLNTLWLNNTALNNQSIQHLKNFKKLGILKIDHTLVNIDGLLSIAANHRLQVVPNENITQKDIAIFEAEQRKLNKKKLTYNPKDISDTKVILNSFFNEMTQWEKDAEQENNFTKELTDQCIHIFNKYCTKKERKGYRPFYAHYSGGPNYTYANHTIVDFEQPSKNKIILYSKDTYLNTQYRFILVRKNSQWKIDEAYELDSGWKKCGL